MRSGTRRLTTLVRHATLAALRSPALASPVPRPFPPAYALPATALDETRFICLFDVIRPEYADQQNRVCSKVLAALVMQKVCCAVTPGRAPSVALPPSRLPRPSRAPTPTTPTLSQIMHMQPWMRHRHYIRRPIYIMLSWLLYFQVATGIGSTLVYQIMK